MRTVHDLEAAFAELADTAPDAGSLTIPTTPARRPLRRTLAPAVAALVTAAVIGSVLVVTLPDDRDGAPAAATLQALQPPASDGPVDTTFRFTADDPAGAQTVRAYAVDRGGQQLEFQRPPDGRRCVTSGSIDVVNVNCRRIASVTLLYAGRPTSSDGNEFDPDEIRDQVPQDVNGAEGFFGRPGGNEPSLPELADRGRGVHLYWQYAPGAWADALAGTRAQALALAQSVRPAERDLTVPVRLRPTAHQYLNTIRDEQSSVGGSYDVTSEDARYGLAEVTWGDGDLDTTGQTVKDPVLLTVGGRSWKFETRNGQAEAVLQNSPVPVTVSGYVGMSRGAMKAIVERVRLATLLTDGTSWFPASDLR